MQTTRLAPSPTGALHLGNARTFLINWLLARQNGWRIVLRIDDLDGPRIKKSAADEALTDLRWLGLDFDDGPIFQSTRSKEYAAAVQRLLDRGDAYPCICTRREAALAGSAPHADDGAAIYPGTCRGRFASIAEATRAAGAPPAIRFRVGDSPVEFADAFRGSVRYDNPAKSLGDFVIAKSDGSAAYQLATVIDDADADVSQVVRGDDLLDSTPRQMLLYRALGFAEKIPTYTHLPLIVGPDGRRLAKRHGDTRISFYRAAGVDAGAIRAVLARWSGVECGPVVSSQELIAKFKLSNMPRGAVTVSRAAEDALRVNRNHVANS